jgi:serine palmitoyltransferase
MRFRGCRVRMCVFATLSWADLHTALNVAIETCVKIGVVGVQRVALDTPAALTASTSELSLVLQQSLHTDKALSEFVLDLARIRVDTDCGVGSHPLVLGAGTAALSLYGIGPCSARWFYGSFDVFVSLEQRLARLYPSLQRLHGRCRGENMCPLSTPPVLTNMHSYGMWRC